MTTSHTETRGAGGTGTDGTGGHPAAAGTGPPRVTARRRRKRTDWGRRVARLACVVLALVGLLPFAATLAVRSSWTRAWAARETSRLLREQGIVATYGMSLRVWPLAVELTNVRLQASDGGAPVLACARARVRPKLFALLAGKLAIDQVEVDEPRVRVVFRDGKLVNLALPPTKERAKTAFHAPFNTFAVTDAVIDLQIDDVRVNATSLDLDVTSEDDPVAGSSFELAVRAGQASVHRPRTSADGKVVNDDDALCSVDGRVRVEPASILVRRFEGVGSADLDAAPGTTPPCDLPQDDKRRVEVSLGHLHVALPIDGARLPAFDGHVRVRAPIALAERAADLPETDGWAAIDVDVRYGDDTLLPDLGGTLEAHDVRLLQYRFAQELHSTFTVRRNVVTSPVTTLRLAGGLVTLTDTVVDPLAKGGKLERTRLDVANADFTTLLRDLGVHPNSYVGWDIREVHAPLIAGTFAPLKLDGDFTAKTYTFGVYDRPAEDKARERLFGFPEAAIAAHLGIRPDGIKFMDVRATLPRSQVEGAFVSIGFHNDLRVETPAITADMDDLSPIGPVTMHGKVKASATVTGTFNHPEPVGDIQSITGFAVADVQFGDLSSGHVKVDVLAPEVDVTGVRARRRDSPYEVPTATLRFGGSRGFVVDAVGASPGFGLRDLLSMFSLDEDPRYDGLDAKIATRAEVHVALGGPEDACGSGYIGVDAKGHLTKVGIFGESFAQGDADVSMHWYDRQAGIAGADLDVRSFVLSKVEPPTGTRAGATGTVLGSASIRRGGAVSANVMVEGVPLGRIDSLGALAHDVEGSISGMAHVTGDMDDFHAGAGLVTRAELDVSGTRVRGVALPSSHLQVEMSQRFTQERRVVGHSRCGAPVAPPFDKATYLADTSSHGEWKLNGELLGGTVRLTDVVATRAKAPRMSGRIALRALDLGLLARIWADRKADADEPVVGTSTGAIGGQIWGELIADDIPLDDPASARVSFLLGPTFVSRGAQKLTLRPPKDPIVIAHDALTMPPLEVTLDASGGFSGGFVLTGGATHLTHDPTLAFDAKLEPIDLAVLQKLVPKVERARGRIEGGLHVTGKASAPTIAGEVRATGDELDVHGLPSALTDMHLDMRASATDLSASGSAKFAGGTISVQASLPVRGFEIGALDSRIVARGIHLTPADGVAATFDADLEVAYDAKARGHEGPSLPRVTGDVTVGSFAYTRPISLTTDLGALGTKAKRTEVNAYDPALDFLALDVHVRAPAPLVIKNNLAEVQLVVDSGALEVTGTNQRIGLRGSLKTLPGGRFHFQGNEFDVRQGLIRFEDPTRVAPNVDITAVTEYRRYTDTSAGAAAGAGASGGPSGASVGSTRGGSVWRIQLHAYGDADNLRVDMTSEPSLSQEDIVLLLAVGMTRAELDQLQASSIGASIALNYLGAASGADRAIKQALPIIDDFRFGSAYSTVTGKTEPQLTVGKRLTNDIRASITAGLSEDRELRSNIEWRLNNRLSVQGSYDNINDVSQSAVGNLGVDLRWRLEFE
jgi:translocation and assembly module TamB